MLPIRRKVLALLAVLASAGPKGVSRERVLSLLWPDAGDSSRGAMKQSIYELRQTLRSQGVVTGTTILILDATEVASDIDDIEAAHSAERWARVVQLYAGPFLEQFFMRGAVEFDHWVDLRRQHYSEMFRRALERSAVGAAERGDTQGAVDLWRRLAAEDPLSGRVALGLLNALAAAGDNAGAMKHYGVHQRLLQEDLATQPDAAVTSAVERIRAGSIRATSEPESVAAVATGGAREGVAEAPADGPGSPAANDAVSRTRGWKRHVWIVVGLASFAAAALTAAWRERGRAHVLATIVLPPNASARVSVDTHLDRIYVDGGASFDHALAVIDGRTYEARTLSHGSGVVVDPLTHWYWTGDYGSRLVVVRNGRTDAEIARVRVPGCPHTLTIGGGRSWVAQQCDDHISVFDNRTRAAIRHIPIPTLSRAEVGGAKGMGEILMNRATGIVYFSKDMIPYRLDPRSWQMRETVGFGGPIIGINDATNRLYARIDSGLEVIDGSTEAIIAYVALGSTPLRLAVGFAGRRTYVVTSEGLSVLDGTTHRVVSRLAFDGGFRPISVAVDDARNRAYVLGAETGGRNALKIVALPD